MTAHDERHATQVQAALVWLEEQLRGTRSAMGRLAQRVDAAEARAQEVEESLGRMSAVVTRLLPRLQEHPETADDAADLRDALAGFRPSDGGRATEPDRALVSGLAHRLEAVERGISALTGRLDTYDEGMRRAVEAEAAVHERIEAVAREVEALGGRLTQVAETSNRIEQDRGRMAGDLETLRRRDDQMAERLQAYAEGVRRVESSLATVLNDTSKKDAAVERIELARAELRRVEERVAGIEADAHDLRTHHEQAVSRLSALDGRQKGYNERLTGAQQEFTAHQARVTDQFARLLRLQERLARRQIEDLERDLRDIRSHAVRTGTTDDGLVIAASPPPEPGG